MSEDVRVINPWVRPEDADLSMPSVKSFQKLALAKGLIVHVQVTRVYVEPTFYLSKSREHNIGDVKDEGYEMECIFISATNALDFAATASWLGGKFFNGFVGGRRTGRSIHAQASHFTQITKLLKEITKWLS